MSSNMLLQYLLSQNKISIVLKNLQFERETTTVIVSGSEG